MMIRNEVAERLDNVQVLNQIEQLAGINVYWSYFAQLKKINLNLNF